jgi:streptomycin 6-kinase
MIISKQLVANCQKTLARRKWLDSLPALLEQLTRRWSLRVGKAFAHTGTCSWIAPAVRADGTSAVLKLGMPHMEGQHEIEGLHCWNGYPTVKLLEGDTQLGAMLLERCRPGTTLRAEPEDTQDQVIATLLKRLWRVPSQPDGLCGFRPLSAMLEVWRGETLAQIEHWPDPGLVGEGLRIMQQLARRSPTDTLLATDLHAGNVLRSEREPWIIIDPKPFIGDRSYDLTQHLMNCEARLRVNPMALIQRLAELAEVDRERLELWTFARAAADPREDWCNMLWIEIAKRLAP